MILIGKTGYKSDESCSFYLGWGFVEKMKLGDGRGIVLKSKMKLRPWKNLEKKMKCGPSICGKAHNQIWQRRICGPQAHTQKTCMDFSIHALLWRPNGRHLQRCWSGRLRRPARAYARVNQLCLFSASRPFTTTPASASFFSRLPVIIGVATSRPISAAWL